LLLLAQPIGLPFLCPVFAAANARALLQQYTDPENTFPYCRCINYSPASSPYVLTGPTVTPLTNGNNQVCFNIQTSQCTSDLSQSDYYCCNVLSASFHKVCGWDYAWIG
jgi:hypothetical protein